MDGLNFLLSDKHQTLYKLTLALLMEVARHVQNCQNRKLAIFLQDLKKKRYIDEVYFLHADKPESFLQIGADILDVFDQT